MKPIDRSSAEHYIWGTVCDGGHLVKRTDMSIIAERAPPGAKETRHIHSTARRIFFILGGRAVIEIDGERVVLVEGQGIELGEGQRVEMAPGASHQFMNESSKDVHFLVVSHPSTIVDRAEI